MSDVPEAPGQRYELDRTVACPTCQAPAGRKCVTPTETSSRLVNWTHSARHDLRVGWT